MRIGSQIFYDRSNYFLFVINVITIFVIAWLPDGWQATLYNAALITLFIASAMVLSRKKEKIQFTVMGILILLSVISRIFGLEILGTINFFLSIIFFGYVVVQLIRNVAVSKTVNRHVLFGAVNGYLLFGILLSIIIAIVETLKPGSFILSKSAKLPGLFAGFDHYLYYGFVSLTTLGYGDYLPNTSGARSIAILMSVSGQLYIGIIIALLVGKFSNTKIEE
ncbi:MAG TPA: hypothetical protein DDY13_17905 [Cytophagales bacterium]|jgi:voltage-gated potassium channel|nr:hypothetical protein [Cytophagales bacterium]